MLKNAAVFLERNAINIKNYADKYRRN